MAGPKEIHKIIEGAVSEVFDSQFAKLREKVVDKVMAELDGILSGPPTGKATDQLNAAVTSLHDSNSQSDILGALLDGAEKFSGRAALFVVRGGEAKGWQGRGFEDNAGVKSVTLDIGKGLVARANQDRMPVAAAAEEFDRKFIKEFGNPADGNALVLPLVVKDKIAAFIYADAGTDADGKLDSSALQLLVRDAGLWLELLQLRKAGGSAVAAAPDHSPAEPMISPPEKVVESVSTLTATPSSALAAAAVAIAAEDEEVHKKAKRFAKLLVDEIKLYNQSKVQQGRENRDLYTRLKDEIEKSRATYEKRYGQTAAGSADYFMQEVVRVLADNDPEALGEGYSQ